MIPGVRLVVLGKQGAGKGTQCVRLSHHYVVPHVSTGDMLRSEVKSTHPARSTGPVADGPGRAHPRRHGHGDGAAPACPSATPRAAASSSTAAPARPGRPNRSRRSSHPFGLDLVIDLQVPTNLVMKRLASRRVCVDCGANYSTAAPPLVNWTCDVCGGEVVQREDDTEEAIGRRLNLYEAETAPLIDWYSERQPPGRDQRHRLPGRRDPPGGGCHRRPASEAEGSGQPVRRNEDELAKMRRAGKVVAEMHEATRAAARPGVTTAELDAVARDVLERRGATSNFLGYHGFPAVICTSPNSMIVHGIPGRLRARGGGHPLHRLRGHHRGVPRRRRLHHGHRQDHLQGGPEAASR